MPNAKQSINLYKALMREAKSIGSYNFREHAKRLIRYHFHQSAALSASEQQEKYDWGLTQVQKVHRIRAMNDLYPAETRTVMEADR